MLVFSWVQRYKKIWKLGWFCAEIFISFGGPLEIVDGEGELEAADVVEDDGGAFLAIDHLYGAQEAFQDLGL